MVYLKCQSPQKSNLNFSVFQQIPESWNSCQCGHVSTETLTIAGKRFSGDSFPAIEFRCRAVDPLTGQETSLDG